MTGLTPHRTIHRLRASGRTTVAIGAMMLMVAFLLPGLTPAAEAQPEDKCTQYYFLYTDGHTDQGEVCDGPVTELHSGTHGIHVPNLHISCSDAFDTWAEPDGDEPGGWDSDGNSDLGTHLIADIGGVAQWGVRKSWTGGDDCGLVAPPPTSDPDPANPAAALAFDCTEGLSLLATNDGDEDAELTVLQGANVIDTITVPKNTTTETEYLVDGENIVEDGSAEFTVMFGTETLVDAQVVEKSCETPAPSETPTASETPTPTETPTEEPTVEGVVIERPPAPAAPADPTAGEPEPAPAVEVVGVTEELPRTGPEDLWLAGFALMLLGAGLLTIARGKAMDATASAVDTSWTSRTA